MDDTTSSPASQPDGEEAVVIRDLDTLRVLSDPLRMRMVELMGRGEWTARQLAASLGVGQTRLYHHIAVLEARGLIRLAGTRLVAGIVEKRYVAPRLLTVDPSLFGGAAETPAETVRAVDALVAAAFATVRREIERAVEAGKISIDGGGASSEATAGRGMTLAFDGARLSEARASEFRGRIEALIHEFSELSKESRPKRDALTGADSDVPSETTGAAAEPVDSAEYRLLVGFFKAADPSEHPTRR